LKQEVKKEIDPLLPTELDEMKLWICEATAPTEQEIL